MRRNGEIAVELVRPPAEKPATEFAQAVLEVLDEVGRVLIEKNKMYGNSALEPVRVFSGADPVEQLKVRIDDKLCRIMRGKEIIDQEDTIMDLIGYLVILKVAQREAN